FVEIRLIRNINIECIRQKPFRLNDNVVILCRRKDYQVITCFRIWVIYKVKLLVGLIVDNIDLGGQWFAGLGIKYLTLNHSEGYVTRLFGHINIIEVLSAVAALTI